MSGAYTYHPPKAHKGGRGNHGMDGKARTRCAVCGRAVRDRRSRLCPDCFAATMSGSCGAGACVGGVGAPLDEKLVGTDDGTDAREWGEV